MRKQKMRILLICPIILLLIIYGSACTFNEKAKDPVTLTVWHVYGGQTDSPLNDLIEEFNKTKGAEKNIKIKATVVSNTNNIHDAVLRAARNEPGAAELPDMFVSYPKTVLAMPDPGILVDYREYFSPEELSAYIPSFLKEGVINGRLLVFPVAKSTEIMFIDKTLFDRFSDETGVKLEQLDTWEGLFEAAAKYYAWTDEKTPEIKNDGKNFFVHDYHFNYCQVGVKSLGSEFFNNGKINYDNTFQKVWRPYAESAIKGGLWLNEGYATDPLRTGDSIVSVASSASVLYYEDIVTFPDNRSEAITVIARPVPCFKSGKKMVMQRGAGFCTVKSTPEKEAASAVFLKWLTEPENNVRFATETGYMPVTKSAFEILPDAIKDLSDPKYKSLYEAFLETQKLYEFYTPPQIDNYLETEQLFEKNTRRKLKFAFKEWQNGGDVDELANQALSELQSAMSGISGNR